MIKLINNLPNNPFVNLTIIIHYNYNNYRFNHNYIYGEINCDIIIYRNQYNYTFNYITIIQYNYRLIVYLRVYMHIMYIYIII